MIGTEAVTIGGMDIIAALSMVAGLSSMPALTRGGRVQITTTGTPCDDGYNNY